MASDNEVSALLRKTLRPYIARLSDPEVIAATDARAAATIVKMLLDACAFGNDAPQENVDTFCRRDVLNTLREIVREHDETKQDEDAPTTKARKSCPEADG